MDIVDSEGGSAEGEMVLVIFYDGTNMKVIPMEETDSAMKRRIG